MRFLYLHGFASGPQSRKAQFLRSALASVGVNLEIPDLAEGSFERLTISRQLKVIEQTLAGEPAALIGSSMGGFLASLYAARHMEISRLVLLAPAFDFARRWRELSGPEGIERWRENGWMEVFYYADQAPRRIHYQLLEDAERHSAYPDFSQPALIFHGCNDATVPVDFSRTFTANRPNIQLIELDSDHELLDVLPAIAKQAVPFLTRSAH